REFCYDGREFVSPMHLEGLEQHAVILDTVSKRYSACGARLGCMITKNQELWQTALKFAQARLSPPAVAQIAAEAAVDRPQSYFDAVKREYEAMRYDQGAGLIHIDSVYRRLQGSTFNGFNGLPLDDDNLI